MSEETPKKERDVKHLEKLTIKELREIAAEIPHERALFDMKKEELVAFIKEAWDVKDDAPSKKKKHVVKIKMTQQELKSRIRALKVLRVQAQEAREDRKVVMLRHQISKLKKKARRVAAA
jgi:hypothetical protein